MLTYTTFQKANNKGADQTARMLFANPRRQVFSRRGPIIYSIYSLLGDLVVFTSTDFDMHQAEVVKIADCQRPTECTNKQIKLDSKKMFI